MRVAPAALLIIALAASASGGESGADPIAALARRLAEPASAIRIDGRAADWQAIPLIRRSAQTALKTTPDLILEPAMNLSKTSVNAWFEDAYGAQCNSPIR